MIVPQTLTYVVLGGVLGVVALLMATAAGAAAVPAYRATPIDPVAALAAG